MGELDSEGQADASLREYRQWLVAAEQKSQDEFDKAVLSLSGGALGISFAFLKDIVGTQPLIQPAFLLVAWTTWGLSILAVLASYYLSHLALRRTIAQVDDQSIYRTKPGGMFALFTAILNAAGAMLFVVGVCCITYFAGVNLPTKGEEDVRKEASISSAKASTSAAAAASGARRETSGERRLSATNAAPAAAPAKD